MYCSVIFVAYVDEYAYVLEVDPDPDQDHVPEEAPNQEAGVSHVRDHALLVRSRGHVPSLAPSHQNVTIRIRANPVRWAEANRPLLNAPELVL